MTVISLHHILKHFRRQPCVYANCLTLFFKLCLSNKFTTYLLIITVYKLHGTYCIKIMDTQEAQ
jgi:hypothetical protein